MNWIAFIYKFLFLSTLTERTLIMKNFIIALVVAFFAFSFYSFAFSGAKKAAEDVKDQVNITSVDKACKQSKDLCKDL
nr:MAG TPA: hypothetical protein [Bacteriophage sp.]